MLLDLSPQIAAELETLSRSMGKSRVDALAYALRVAKIEIAAEREFRSENSVALEYSADDVMEIMSQAVKADRAKRRRG